MTRSTHRAFSLGDRVRVISSQRLRYPRSSGGEAVGREGEVVSVSNDTSPPYTVQFRSPNARASFYGDELRVEPDEFLPIGTHVRASVLGSLTNTLEGTITAHRPGAFSYEITLNEPIHHGHVTVISRAPHEVKVIRRPFRAGDRVQLRGTTTTARVTRIILPHQPTRVRIQFEEGGGTAIYDTHELQLVAELRTFRPGDRVTISEADGIIATVGQRLPGDTYQVSWGEGITAVLPAYDLTLFPASKRIVSSRRGEIIEIHLKSRWPYKIQFTDDRQGLIKRDEFEVTARPDSGDPSDTANRWVRSVVRAFNANGYRVVKTQEMTRRGHAVRVLKYTIDENEPLVLPAGSRLLCAAEQHGVYRVWAEVPQHATTDEVRYELTLIPTGFLPVPAGFIYLDTIFASNGNVWHVYYLLRGLE